MRLGPFTKRKEVILPTWRGWLLLLALAICFFFGILFSVAPFLSPVKPIQAEVLVMEGWVSESTIREAIRLNASGSYKLVISTGLAVEKGMDISHYGTYADLGVARLKALGFKGTNLVAVRGPNVPKDRTYQSAVALRGYLLTNTPYRTVNLISDSVHSRRSWYLFEHACRPEIQVGIIAHRNPDFDVRRWWRTSQGVRMVLNELIAYIYARVFFDPD